MVTNRFTITIEVEHGQTHYKIHDSLTGKDIHCDSNELNKTLWKLLGVR